MHPRRRRAAFGLRGRIVGAVLVVSVATLGVAAIALFGPLENTLRNAAKATFVKDLGGVQRRYFSNISWSYLPLAGVPQPDGDTTQRSLTAHHDGLPEPYIATDPKLLQDYTTGEQALDAVIAGANRVESQTGGSAVVRQVLADATAPLPGQQADDDGGNYADALQAYAQHSRVISSQSILGIENVTAAIPLKGPYVLIVRKPVNEIRDAVKAVRHAFLYAVIAGLILSILLGVPLAARLVRRLRQLREAALKLARGSLAAEVPDDRVRDEVGDLARSFVVMQQRLAHQEEARRAFVATASHELRTPLTSLEGMLELLDDDLQQRDPDIADARELLASARMQSRRLGRLAADLLDLSRIDAEVSLRSEPIELGELSRAVLAEFDLGTSARGINTGLEDPGTPVWALGDPGSVARILRILLDNAVRASPAGTEVTVAVSHEPTPSLRVRDRGPGVEEAERELIFQRFHRGRATAGDAGFGLGLAIGRELAERMGGALVLDAADGPGARFTLTLPAAKTTDQDPLLML